MCKLIFNRQHSKKTCIFLKSKHKTFTATFEKFREYFIEHDTDIFTTEKKI